MICHAPTYSGPTSVGANDDPMLPVIRASIAPRLARVCENLTADDFERLVDQVARFQRRWEIREAVEREALRALARDAARANEEQHGGERWSTSS